MASLRSFLFFFGTNKNQSLLKCFLFTIASLFIEISRNVLKFGEKETNLYKYILFTPKITINQCRMDQKNKHVFSQEFRFIYSTFRHFEEKTDFFELQFFFRANEYAQLK